MSELLYQVQQYLSFMWASGGLVHDYTSHNIDECCWMKGAWPVRAQGSGGRCYRGDAVDQNFDHYSVEYTFADGTNLFMQRPQHGRLLRRVRQLRPRHQGLGRDLDLHAHAGQVPHLQGAQLRQAATWSGPSPSRSRTPTSSNGTT